MELIKNYLDARQEIYDHVGFEEDWVVYPIDDCTDKFWSEDGKIVRYANTEDEFKEQYNNYYEDEIYTQRFYKKWVYEGKDFTMIFCNPRVDGMIWFRIFDNKKRVN